MINRATEEHKLWLFDLSHGNIDNSQIVAGFIKYYALEGLTYQNVVDDVVFRTSYEPQKAKENLLKALHDFVEK